MTAQQTDGSIRPGSSPFEGSIYQTCPSRERMNVDRGRTDGAPHRYWSRRRFCADLCAFLGVAVQGCIVDACALVFVDGSFVGGGESTRKVGGPMAATKKPQTPPLVSATRP